MIIDEKIIFMKGDQMKKSAKYLKILCNIIAMLLTLFFVFYILPRAVVYFMPFVVGFVIAKR